MKQNVSSNSHQDFIQAKLSPNSRGFDHVDPRALVDPPHGTAVMRSCGLVRVGLRVDHRYDKILLPYSAVFAREMSMSREVAAQSGSEQ